MPDEIVNVRYMVDDVEAAIGFYTTHFGFTRAHQRRAGVRRRRPRQPAAAAQRTGELGGRPMPDGRKPEPGRLEPHPLDRRRHRAPRSSGCGPRGSRSATTSSPAPAARRSCSRTPPATRSSSSSRPAPHDEVASRAQCACASSGASRSSR